MMTGTALVQLVFQANTYAMIYMTMIFFYFFQTPMFSQTNSLILTYIEGTQKIRLVPAMGLAWMGTDGHRAGPVIDRLGSGRIAIVFSIIASGGRVHVYAPSIQKTTASASVSLRGLSRLFLNSYFVCFILLGITVSIPNTANNTFMSLYPGAWRYQADGGPCDLLLVDI